MSDYPDLSSIAYASIDYDGPGIERYDPSEDTPSMSPAHGPWSAIGDPVEQQNSAIDPALMEMHSTGPISKEAMHPRASMQIIPSHMGIIADTHYRIHGMSKVSDSIHICMKTAGAGNLCLSPSCPHRGFQAEVPVGGHAIGTGMDYSTQSHSARPHRRSSSRKSNQRQSVLLSPVHHP